MEAVPMANNKKFGKVKSVRIEDAENGYIITAEDDNYNSKRYIESDKTLAATMAADLMKGPKIGNGLLGKK